MQAKCESPAISRILRALNAGVFKNGAAWDFPAYALDFK
jgi:hypothetical protein